jgi:hypothetical protein
METVDQYKTVAQVAAAQGRSFWSPHATKADFGGNCCRWMSSDIYKLYVTTDITVETAAGGCLPTSTNCT